MAVQSLQFLGIRNEGPAGIYTPGDTQHRWLVLPSQLDQRGIDVELITSQDTTPINWEPVRESLRPSSISVEAWLAVFANLTDSIPTWGKYVIMLNKTLTPWADSANAPTI